jgi:hypothetical protein
MNPQNPSRKTQMPDLSDSSANTGRSTPSLFDHIQQTAKEHPVLSTFVAGTAILGSSLLFKRNLIGSISKLSENLMTTPGGKFSNIYSGTMSPFMETTRSKITTGQIMGLLREKPDTQILGIGHSEGGQNLLRATDKRSVENYSRSRNPVGMMDSWSDHDPLADEALKHQDIFTQKNHDMMEQRVHVATFGSPSASSGKFNISNSQHFQHEDDGVARVLYGNGKFLPNMTKLHEPKPGGHAYENYAPEVNKVIQNFYEKHGRDNSVVIHSGGMNTSNETVTKRATLHENTIKNKLKSL